MPNQVQPTATAAASNYGGLFSLLIIALFVAIILVALWFLIKYFNKNKIKRAKDWIMLQISVPRDIKKPDDANKQEDFKQFLSVADQFFSSLIGISGSKSNGWFDKPKYSFEIICKKGEILFYVGAPKSLVSYVEKQIQSYYPYAQIEQNDSYKIFQYEDNKQISYATLGLTKRYVYPIKTYKTLEHDPINGITNVMSKLREDEAAVIQILLQQTSSNWRINCSRATLNVKNGKMVYDNAWQAAFFGLFDIAGSFKSNSGASDSVESSRKHLLTPQQDELMKAFNEKGSKIGYKTQIRIVSISNTKEEANANAENIISSFSQYKAPQFNGFRKLTNSFSKTFIFLSDFILREFDMFKPTFILNTEELASLWHLPNKFTETPNVSWIKARVLPPPPDLPKEGTLMGESNYRGEIKKVYIKHEDRRKHIFMIGKTGTGKTTLFTTMIKQDIERGYGCCFIDPNGDAAESILRFIPKERAEDVIYFDPSDSERPMGLNLLEWKRPEDKDYLIAEWLEIFYKLFDPNRTGMVGPQFEHWGRNAALTIMSQPGGGSLLEIPRLFTDDEFREKCISYVKDPVVQAFWQQQMAKTADIHKSEMFNYFISKFGRFMTNDLMRNIIGQAKSAFDIREAMDSNKILIINLSKGKIGEMNSYMLGMILVSKIQVAAFQRADTPEEQRKDFYLYVDEFQNFTTDSFKTILSEARKYRLNLAITNQYIQQLTEQIRDACIGNAGTMLCYRVGAADAEFMEKEFPGVTQNDLTNLPFATLYTKLLINGSPSKPFTMKGIKSEPGQSEELASAIRQLSRLKYGRVKEEVEEEIRQRTLIQDNVAPEPGPPREA